MMGSVILSLRGLKYRLHYKRCDPVIGLAQAIDYPGSGRSTVNSLGYFSEIEQGILPVLYAFSSP